MSLAPYTSPYHRGAFPYGAAPYGAAAPFGGYGAYPYGPYGMTAEEIKKVREAEEKAFTEAEAKRKEFMEAEKKKYEPGSLFRLLFVTSKRGGQGLHRFLLF